MDSEIQNDILNNLYTIVRSLTARNEVLQGRRLGISFFGWNKGPISITNPKLGKKFLAEKKIFDRKIFFGEKFLMYFLSNSYAQFERFLTKWLKFFITSVVC